MEVPEMVAYRSGPIQQLVICSPGPVIISLLPVELYMDLLRSRLVLPPAIVDRKPAGKPTVPKRLWGVSIWFPSLPAATTIKYPRALISKRSIRISSLGFSDPRDMLMT
jgi:hypothetical protein